MRFIFLSLSVLAAGFTCRAADGDGLLPTGGFRIRDPFVLAENGTYYLYEAKPWSGGRSVNVFTSKDLKRWTPKVPVMELSESNACTAVWAPEVHKYKGKYWLFVTLTFPADPSRPLKRMEQDGHKAPGDPQPRGVWVFRGESPMGPFAPVKEGSVTPYEWMCLDGTLWVEDGQPWMVFCHEWAQTGNGRMMAAPLSDDLSRFTAEPVELFKATDAPNGGVVTDGPFLWRQKGVGLRMIWSNMLKGKGYCVIQCRSKTGKVTGPWYMHTPLYAHDGGHGMLFRTFEGELMLALHQPNASPDERMRLYPLYATWEGFARADWQPFGPAWQAQWTPAFEAAIDARIERHRKADAVVDGLPPGAEVKVEQTSSQFLVGCNMFNFDQLGSDALNAEYRAAFTNLFNAATLAFYWKNMEPREGQFRFESGPRDLPEFWNAFDHEKDDAYKLVEWRRPAPDRLIEFCRANGVAMHGHALIYVAWSPDWLWDVATTPEKARHWYDRHIYDMALHYGDAIPQWDVVNESLNRDSTRESPDDAKNWFTGRRPGVVLPPDYTRRAFELADRLFPKNVRLAVNDAWTVANDAYAAFAQKLIRDGARVDEVGYQKHIFNPRDLLSVASGFPCLTNSQTWDVADETNRLAEIDARTSRPIHISEVTIPSPRGLAGLTDAEADAIQARVTRAYYRLWFSWPSVERITYWNLVDGLGAKNERMSSGWYNRDMTKKAVWHAMDRLFNHEWRTRLTAKADASGRLSFRGFKGRYRLTWRRADGTTETRELILER